jgi:hypothetical protein
VDSATFEAYTAKGEQIEVGFYINANQNADNFAILIWKDGQWVEQQVVIEDGVISSVVTEGTLFVLVSK